MIIIIIIIITYFTSVDPYGITKSKWIWKSSHFRENKEYIHYKVYIIIIIIIIITKLFEKTRCFPFFSQQL